MATRPKAVIESRNGEEFSPITIAKNVLTDDGQNLHDILSDRKEDMMTPTIENSSSMFKVGQGDNVDYSSNIVNGAYESMVLKGKTMVNCIQESSSRDVVLPYEFEDGQYVTINDTKESGALGVELKGQTLVNLVGEKREYNRGVLYGWEFMLPYKLTKNARYMVIFNASGTITNNSKVYLMDNGFGSDSGNTPYPVSFTLGYNKHITTASGDNHKVLRIRTDSQAVNDFKVSDVMLIPYQEGMENWDIPYFKGMASCKMPILHTVGKNLFNKELIVESWVDGNTGIDTGNSGCYVPIRVSGAIAISGYTPYNGQPTYVYEYDRNGKYIKRTSGSSEMILNLNENTELVKVGFYKGTVEHINSLNIQVEKGTQATTYEPYKSSILSLPEEVVLRSLPNGVCDTFNTRTGVYTQRIWSATFNGTESYSVWESSFVAEGMAGIYTRTKVNDKIVTSENLDGQILCDTLPIIPRNQLSSCQYDSVVKGNNYIGFTMKSKTSEEIKQWLSENPTTVYCELKTPIIKKINLSSTLKSWNTTTHIYSEIPENTLYPILSHSSNPTYPVILKPSTKYSIVANSYGNNHTNSTINFNLGGATASTTVGNRVTTITTPSTLSNELLTMSGRGNKLNNVMVIEGDVVGDEPYFEGICDCKSPILSNVGKNICDLRNYTLQPSYGNANPTIISATQDTLTFKPSRTDDWSGVRYKLKPNKFYSVTVKVTCNINSGYRVFFNNEGEETRFAHVANGAEYTRIFDGSTEVVTIGGIRNSEGTAEYTIDYLSIIESPNKTNVPYEPYKSNILSCNGDKIELTEDMFEQGHCGYNSSVIGSTYDEFKSVAAPSYQATRVRSKSLVKVKPNTTYFIKADSTKYNFGMQGFDNNKLSIGYDTHWQTDYVFTTPANMYYASLHIRKNNNDNLTPANVDYNCIQLSEIDKTIVLRSLPNGVCDTLNVETGEYVQRIGEIVLDGSEEGWTRDSSSLENSATNKFYISNYFKNAGFVSGAVDKSNLVCHKLSPVDMNIMQNSATMVYCIANSAMGSLNIRCPKSVDSINALKTWLQANPINVHCELATPIVSTVDIQGFPHAYKNGHVQLSSGSIEQSLTPKVEYSVVTNRNGQIRSNQKMVERHQKQLDRLQAMILTNLVNTQYEQALTNLKYNLKNVREEVK